MTTQTDARNRKISLEQAVKERFRQRKISRGEAIEQKFAGYNDGEHLPVLARHGETVTIRTQDGRQLTVWIGESNFDLSFGDESVRSIVFEPETHDATAGAANLISIRPLPRTKPE